MAEAGSGRVAGVVGGGGPPAGPTFFTVFLGPDQYEPVAECLRFAPRQLCAGEVCGAWSRTPASEQQTGLVFTFDFRDAGSRVRIDGQGRYDRRGEGDSIAGVGRTASGNRNLSFSFAGRAVGPERCRSMRQAFGGASGTWWRSRR